ncbi:MAG: amidohydrolase [Mesorhizobium sp.]|nr:MAG: amidohydrolase [Mesorhizobium sp.]
MLKNMPVIDAVVHPFNFQPENFSNRFGHFFTEMIAKSAFHNSPDRYRVPEKAYRRDWGIEEIANAAFIESDTDIAVYHVLPLNAFKDGACGIDKAVEARRRWPNRFLFYIGVDPLQGQAALSEMQRQYDALEGDVVGLKLYPNSWLGEEIRGWLMSDPNIAFPVFRKAQELGLRTVAIHKAFAMGPAEMLHYRVDDVDFAAKEFPEINFEIVHGGLAFVEETTWQLRRFQNVYANLESTTMNIVTRPLAFENVLASFMRFPYMTDHILWATGGCMVGHPRMLLDAFSAFKFRGVTVEEANVPQITDADKRKILSENYVRMTGVDLASRLRGIENDEFAQRRREAGDRPEPYSTTRVREFA